LSSFIFENLICQIKKMKKFDSKQSLDEKKNNFKIHQNIINYEEIHDEFETELSLLDKELVRNKNKKKDQRIQDSF
jgi:hypothetical protein